MGLGAQFQLSVQLLSCVLDVSVSCPQLMLAEFPGLTWPWTWIIISRLSHFHCTVDGIHCCEHPALLDSLGSSEWCLLMRTLSWSHLWLLFVFLHRAAPAAPWHPHSLKNLYWFEWCTQRSFTGMDIGMNVWTAFLLEEECGNKILFWSTVIAEESSSSLQCSLFICTSILKGDSIHHHGVYHKIYLRSSIKNILKDLFAKFEIL